MHQTHLTLRTQAIVFADEDTSSGDLYALLVCVIFCFRIRVLESCKPCYLLFVTCIVLGYELQKFVSLVYYLIVYGLGIV